MYGRVDGCTRVSAGMHLHVYARLHLYIHVCACIRICACTCMCTICIYAGSSLNRDPLGFPIKYGTLVKQDVRTNPNLENYLCMRIV